MAMSIKSVFEFLIEKKFAVWSSLISSLLIIGQEIFTTYAFKCPCDHELSMAITCMVVLIPVVVLVCFGCLLQSDAWTPCSGCSSGRKCRCASCCWAVMAKASVAPIVWLSIALLTGDYYACAKSSSFSPSSATLGVIRNVSGSITEVLARVPCPDITLHPSIPDATAANIRREINTKLHTLSQIYGFTVIAISMILGTLTYYLARCCSKRSAMEERFRSQYKLVEREVFKNRVDESARNRATQDADTFIKDVEKFSQNGAQPNLERFHEAFAEISIASISDDGYFSRLNKYSKCNAPTPAEQ